MNNYVGSNKVALLESTGKCVGCNKCLRSCAAGYGLNAFKCENEQTQVKIDYELCIHCGSCYKICDHDAIDYYDDTEPFFDSLRSGQKISLLIAPSFFANYADNYKEILGGLKALGVNKVINVGFGADITTWGYINYMKNNNFYGGITQPCPTVVSYIEHFQPDLIPKLMPIQSPMMCSAIYARNELKITDELAFISPCISKKAEQVSKRGNEIISYNVTFKKLIEYVLANNITGEFDESEIEYGIGTIYPISGGLSESVKWFLGEEQLIRHIDGTNTLLEFFKENSKYIIDNKNPYLLIDALNCDKGCSFGPATENFRFSSERPILELMKIRNKVKTSSTIGWTKELPPEKRLELLNDKFKNLDIKDYMCEYVNYSNNTKLKKPNDTEIKYIFHTMNKDTLAETEIHCGCCGYNTCTEMAIAIHNKKNIKENCVYFIKDEVANERDRAQRAEIYIELAIKDLQTGLFNRNAYYSWLDGKTTFENCGVLTFDLNDLKKCNDTYGHDAGDMYIKSAVDIIVEVLGDLGKTYRIGGDEFSTVIENPDVKIIEECIEKIEALCEEYNNTNSLINFMRIASGYAVFDKTLDNDFSDTVRRSDVMMYKTKARLKGNN